MIRTQCMRRTNSAWIAWKKCFASCKRQRFMMCFIVFLLLPILGYASDPFPILLTSLDYPIVALQAGVSGTVVVECSLTADGHVESVQPVSGPPILVDAVLANAKKWQFSPDGINTRRHVLRLFYDFKIKGVSAGRPKSEFAWAYSNTINRVTVTSPRPEVMVSPR